MENELKLTEFRTKEELKDYLLSKGIDVSDDAIENLKKQYKNKQIVRNALTMQELDDVAGGAEVYIFETKSKKLNVEVSFNGKQEFRVYLVNDDYIINGRLDLEACKNNNEIFMDSREYNIALTTAKNKVLEKFGPDVDDLDENGPNGDLVKEGKYINGLTLQQVGPEPDEDASCVIM